MSDSVNPAENEVTELLQRKEFGAPLKKAREKLKLSVSDVADNLMVPIDTIKAIESSQMDSLPALTFTQGYIRNYARLVDVSADGIIQDYLSMLPDSEQAFTPHSVIPVQKNSNDVLLRFISVSFAITFAVILFYWLFTTDFKTEDVQKNKTSDTGIALSVLGDDQALNTLQQNREEDTSHLDAETVNDSLRETIPLAIINTSSESVGLETDSTAQKDKNINNDTKKSKALDSLILSALGKSWCEVQDSNGKRLYYQLLNRGDEITLSGVAPFSLFLGNAPDVRVEINNKIVDFEHLINANSNIANLEVSKGAVVERLTNR